MEFALLQSEAKHVEIAREMEAGRVAESRLQAGLFGSIRFPGTFVFIRGGGLDSV
jgi:hypothetical protein